MQGLDIVVYGDSIMEAFRGTMLGQPLETYDGNKAIWQRLMGGRRAAVLAIAGDQPVHLLWRLANGEGPAGLNPKQITVMIGTNDVGRMSSFYEGNVAQAAHFISLGLQRSVLELQRQAPAATIVVLGLLPIGHPSLSEAQGNLFTEVLKATNDNSRQFVEQQASQKLKFIECGGRFLHEANGTVNHSLMPDGLHPAGEGGEVLLRCMLEGLEINA